MFIKIPFESEIDFKTNISEITKMSLEHDFNINDGVVLGNFYVSGEYRSHEVSVNTENFKYTLPFTVELRDDLRKDTLEFNIEDFSYEIKDNNKLKVNIVYSLTGEVEEELFERVDEEKLESELEFIDDFLEKDGEIENKEELAETPELVIDKEDKEEKDLKKVSEKQEEVSEKEVEDQKENEKDERIDLEDEKTIMETIKDGDDTFVTYHVHIVKENETIEMISSIYKVPSNVITEYNGIDSISLGDKIIIPKCDE